MKGFPCIDLHTSVCLFLIRNESQPNFLNFKLVNLQFQSALFSVGQFFSVKCPFGCFSLHTHGSILTFKCNNAYLQFCQVCIKLRFSQQTDIASNLTPKRVPIQIRASISPCFSKSPKFLWFEEKSGRRGIFSRIEFVLFPSYFQL